MPEAEIKLVGTAASDWRTGSLRLTALRTPTSDAPTMDWWSKTTGNEPESRTSKPKAGEFVDQGPVADGNLILSIRPERIDWQYVAVRQEDATVSFPDVGDFRAATVTFIQLMKKWLEVCPPVGRLAFGASLVQPVGSREEGYAKLAKYLPSVKIDSKGSSDLMYQINRIRASRSLDGLSVNRLSRWDVLSAGRVQIEIIPADQVKMSARNVSGTEFAVHTELDINTSPEPAKDLPHELLPAILDELLTLAIEISVNGDIG